MPHPSTPIQSLLERMFAVGALLLMTDAIVLLALQGGAEVSTLDAAEGYGLFQYLATAVYAVAGLLVVMRLNAFLALCRQQPLLLALVVLALATTAWSVMPEVTGRRGVALIGTTVFALWLVIRFRPDELLRLVGVALGIAMVASLLCVVLLPEYGVHQAFHIGDWRGVFVQKNVMGRVALLALITFAALSLRSAESMRPIWLMLLALSVFMVIMSGSRTAWIVLLGLAGTVPVVHVLRMHGSLLAPVLWLAPALLVVIGTIVVTSGADLLAMMDRDVTLTGRTIAWELGALSAMERPWLGWGYGAFWHSDEGAAGFIRYQLGWRAYTTGHNGYLDLWLEVGLIGAVLWLAMLTLAVGRLVRLIRIQRRTMQPLIWWYVLFAVYLLLLNVPGTMSLARNNIAWVMLVMMVCHARILSRSEQRQTTAAPDRGREAALPPAEPSLVNPFGTRRRPLED